MGLVSTERRALLRRLKAEFDEAFADVEPLSDRSSVAYRMAEEAYKDWRRVSDTETIALIDDLDTAAVETDKLRRELSALKRLPESAVPLIDQIDAEHVFEEIDKTLQSIRSVENCNWRRVRRSQWINESGRQLKPG